MREIDRGIRAGMDEREAAYWREAVTDPCGCTEGLLGGLVTGVSLALKPLSIGTRVSGGVRGFLVGALAGKAVGVARGLGLVRHQRRALTRRVDELERLEHREVPRSRFTTR